MTDHLQEAVEAAAKTFQFGDRVYKGDRLLAKAALEAAAPILEAHYREKLEARLLSDEAVERAAQAAWEPERIVSWEYATEDAKADARKRVRLALEAALQVDEESPRPFDPCPDCGGDLNDGEHREEVCGRVIR